MNSLLIISAIILFGIIISVANHRRMKKLALSRGEPNICEYARSFDFRQVDTKIIREVWNYIQSSLGNFNGKPFPIKADDLFNETYKFDEDDLDEIYWAVADKLGIDTKNPQNNPYYNQVTSVRNLVLFLHYQPRLKELN
jgi:hypothetical protein